MTLLDVQLPAQRTENSNARSEHIHQLLEPVYTDFSGALADKVKRRTHVTTGCRCGNWKAEPLRLGVLYDAQRRPAANGVDVLNVLTSEYRDHVLADVGQGR